MSLKASINKKLDRKDYDYKFSNTFMYSHT